MEVRKPETGVTKRWQKKKPVIITVRDQNEVPISDFWRMRKGALAQALRGEYEIGMPI